LIGVCTGPGSFTGLRIGVAFAKTLAQTLAVPIAGVSTYDIVAFGHTRYPMIAVARGKKDYYYARVLEGANGEPRFMQGSRAQIERVASELAAPSGQAVIVGPDFSAVRPGDAARAVVELARQARARGQELEWPNITIDYGQRPNAVLNWERRHATGQEGRAISRREPPGE
jgi:tRNA threonylcarbamoyl adenosine modification protein YeaZ